LKSTTEVFHPPTCDGLEKRASQKAGAIARAGYSSPE
jgi:hypothetical protein